MKLFVLTAEHFFDGEPQAINRLFGNGMDVLHVRKPCASFGETKRFIEQIDEVFHPQIVVHDHYELASLLGLKGIHLNRRNEAPYSPSCGKFGLSVSRSCHSFEEIAEAPAEYDYMFLSPVFDSLSKAGYKRRYTPDQWNEASLRGLLTPRVIALGGITAARVPVVRRYGFGGVAVSGSLWMDAAGGGLTERFNELKRKCAEDVI